MNEAQVVTLIFALTISFYSGISTMRINYSVKRIDRLETKLDEVIKTLELIRRTIDTRKSH